jgi:hypothetical protein
MPITHFLYRSALLSALLFCFLPLPLAANENSAALRFIRAYPEAGMALEQTGDGLYVVIQGTRLLFEPRGGCPSVQPDSPDDPPLCATMTQGYPAGTNGRYPAKGFDPGRTRSETLLKLLYGQSAEEVRQQCVDVPFLGTTVLFSSRQGAARALARVATKLEKLCSEDPALLRYILPTPGAYAWRVIEGSGRLSAHSFGIALDLNVDKGPYWRWASPASAAVQSARKGYPQAIVQAFEDEGFIWGGKWSHFDFMHFEYRPELLGPGAM